jgi:hypothetical protein
MNDGVKRFSRKELYEQVWSVSMVKLSEQYGLSDVGLAKICKKHNIPRPPRGYWARKAAGYNVKQIPLPLGEDLTIEITTNPYSNVSKRKSAISELIPAQGSEEKRIVVPDRLSSPHPLTKQSSEILGAQQANEVGLLEPPEKDCLDITVSKDSLRRALRIMDTILKALEKQEYEVSLVNGFTQTIIADVPVRFGISEKLITRKVRPEEHYLDGSYKFGYNRFVDERKPSGDLRLRIHDADRYWAQGCQKNWNDTKRQKLETRIREFIEGLANVAVARIEYDKQQEEEERQRLERQKLLEQERQRRAELRRRYLEEQERVSNLISNAENWKTSQILREYIGEIEKHATGHELPFSSDKPLEEWLQWARDQAARLDPLSPSPPSILDEECPEEDSRNDYSRQRDW